MRLRHKPWAKEKIEAHPDYVVPNPETFHGRLNELFGNENPVHIEVGTGKGRFVSEMARANPSINYIGIELQESVIVSALDRLIEGRITKCEIVTHEWRRLRKYFAKGDIQRVYLNFSDPWPKKRHEKRRLTSESFLNLYKAIMIDAGEIHFKTDNRGLFEYSLISFTKYGLQLSYVSLDLHNSDLEGNIMTEYEEKFSAKGQPIYRCEVLY